MQVSDQAKPQADKFNAQAIDPAARAVEQNARPLADKAVEKGIQPGARVRPGLYVSLTNQSINHTFPALCRVCVLYLVSP